MIRHHDWPERLIAYLAGQRRLIFRWGERDCALMCWDAIRAMTGIDLGAPFRGRYASREEAQAIITEFCGSPAATLEHLAEIVFRAAGCPPLAAIRAQRGDAVLADTELGPSLGIVGPDGVYFAALRGTTRLPLRACRRAWRTR